MRGLIGGATRSIEVDGAALAYSSYGYYCFVGYMHIAKGSTLVCLCPSPWIYYPGRIYRTSVALSSGFPHWIK